MSLSAPQIFIGDTAQRPSAQAIRGEYVTLLGDTFYKIENYDAMEPFFMSLVSRSDHWLFIASTGGLSAGRGSAEQALFPYYTVDKLMENSENTGHKAIFLVTRGGRTSLWEPFSIRQQGSYRLARNLYKNVLGTALIFEENNLDLGLNYRYAWRTSERFGLVVTAWLSNAAGTTCQVELLSGLQNLLPANVVMATQNVFSSLLDAYKRSELHAPTGLGLFALSSTLTDLAEPSESLRANTVVQVGLPSAGYLLASEQLDRFRRGEALAPETDVRGRRGAYFAHAQLDLPPHAERTWHLLADVQQDAAAIMQKIAWLQGSPADLFAEVETDIAASQLGLWNVVASADGLQLSNQPLLSAYHLANVMFNVMRGGFFADQYWIQSAEFADFVAGRNRKVWQAQAAFWAALPARLHLHDLLARAEAQGASDLIRLSYSYLPLTFSRRHGDPSRPWNRFAINVKKPDGSRKLDYEGNWRDIFQNWEALAYSYPEFIESMISTFLNATTADGYNPYRITYQGLDWEIPEPGNPWANIGYWSDHQIIYLQKLMEISAKVHPGKLQSFLNRALFSTADIPYRLKPYADLLKDPYATIDFDWEAERRIDARQKEQGTDGKLVCRPGGDILHVSLAEKLLILLLAKLSNFVPEGGIWMNTQRPEWNDANNALVGKGLSVVTLCQLRRYVAFFRQLLADSPLDAYPLSTEVQAFYGRIGEALQQFRPALHRTFTDEERLHMMDALGQAGSDYRWQFYRNGFSGQMSQVPASELVAFLDLAQAYVEHSLRANRRSDDLYHAYNILHLAPGRASVDHLYEMLEGQVAILTSGLLSGEAALALLRSMRQSALYMPDQHSYILYPDRNLLGFLKRNCLTQAQVDAIPLLGKLVAAQDRSILTRDVRGFYHFAGHIRNFRDVSRALEALKQQPRFASEVDAAAEKIHALFEATFRHDEFTGRSGTFFAYEGLGSIYWHMVSKLLLAVQEAALQATSEPVAKALLESYADIRQGLGFNKPPDAYGAFPTDPYSHTPKGQGAKQPGMTGQVKEAILSRQAELGWSVERGQLVFAMTLVDQKERLTSPAAFAYLDVNGQRQELALAAGSLAYTVCQTPVVIEVGAQPALTIHLADGSVQHLKGLQLDAANSQHIFERDGTVHHLTVTFPLAA